MATTKHTEIPELLLRVPSACDLRLLHTAATNLEPLDQKWHRLSEAPNDLRTVNSWGWGES